MLLLSYRGSNLYIGTLLLNTILKMPTPDYAYLLWWHRYNAIMTESLANSLALATENIVEHAQANYKHTTTH